MKKTKLIWGIMLTIVGAVGFCGMASANNISKVAYAIICVLFIAAGVLLIVLYKHDQSEYDRMIERELERRRAERRLEDSRRKLRQARIDAELEKMESAKKALQTCPACGAATKGNVCQYCGYSLQTPDMTYRLYSKKDKK